MTHEPQLDDTPQKKKTQKTRDLQNPSWHFYILQSQVTFMRKEKKMSLFSTKVMCCDWAAQSSKLCMRRPGLTKALGSSQSQRRSVVAGSDSVSYFMQTIILQAADRRRLLSYSRNGLADTEIRAVYASAANQAIFKLLGRFFSHVSGRKLVAASET